MQISGLFCFGRITIKPFSQFFCFRCNRGTMLGCFLMTKSCQKARNILTNFPCAFIIANVMIKHDYS